MLGEVCPEYKPSQGETVVSQTSDSVELQCTSTGQTWTLKCEEKQWVGDGVDCSAPRKLIVSPQKNPGTYTQLPRPSASKRPMKRVKALQHGSIAADLSVTCFSNVDICL